MNIQVIVYEDGGWKQFLPLVYSRPVFQLVCGVGCLLARVQRLVRNQGLGNGTLGVWCRGQLAGVTREETGLFVNRPLAGPGLLLNGRGFWFSLPLINAADQAWVGTAGHQEEIACIFADEDLRGQLESEGVENPEWLAQVLADLPRRNVDDKVKLMAWPWELVHTNEAALCEDWRELAAQGAILGQVSDGSHILNAEAVYVASGARVKPGAVIDAEDGPVWIDRDVLIQPHTYIQGPAYIGPATLLQPGAVVREGTSIGPVCKVGGEIEVSIIQGYSNKQHDGFMGHSYIGSWVNMGADCINSDLKNTYGKVRVPINGREEDTGEIFVGMIVGDHSKIGINTSVPTGAVIGFCSSIAGTASPKFVPSFSWVEGGRREAYDRLKALDVAHRVLGRRELELTEAAEKVFLGVAEQAPTLEWADPQNK